MIDNHKRRKMPDLDFMKTSKRKIRSVPASPKQSPTRGGTSKWVRPSGFLPKNLRKKSADFHTPSASGSQNNRPKLTSSSPVLNKANCVSSPNTPLNGSRPDLRKLFQNPKTHSENEKSNHQLKKPKIIRESVSDDESYDKIEDSRKNQFLSKEFNRRKSAQAEICAQSIITSTVCVFLNDEELLLVSVHKNSKWHDHSVENAKIYSRYFSLKNYVKSWYSSRTHKYNRK